MSGIISRRSFLAASALGAALLAGCSGGGGAASDSKVKVGTLATEDLLPLWAAQSDGLFAGRNLDVEIVTFQSAIELTAGVASGEVDLAMTDIMVTAGMFASGTAVQMEWVTLGATADQGRFGIMVGPNSAVKSLTELANVKIGVGTNTILEYVMDRLMEQAGVPADQVVIEELPKLPVRYQMMTTGEVPAAALPGTLLALGEANGCRLVADDTTGDNISQSVMVSRSAFVSNDANRKKVEALKAVWNDAVAKVNANPEAYRSVLIENVNLSDQIANTYPISRYPEAALPTSAMVNPVLLWMEGKGYLSKPLTYNESTGEFHAA